MIKQADKEDPYGFETEEFKTKFAALCDLIGIEPEPEELGESLAFGEADNYE